MDKDIFLRWFFESTRKLKRIFTYKIHENQTLLLFVYIYNIYQKSASNNIARRSMKKWPSVDWTISSLKLLTLIPLR